MRFSFASLRQHLVSRRLSGALASASLSLILILSGTHSALADAASFGEVMCNVADNMTPFMDIFYWLSYVASVFFIVQGVLALKGHRENPSQHPHHKTIAMLVAGTLLGSLPLFVSMMIDTIFEGSSGDASGLGACMDNMAGATATSGTAVPLDVMMTNFITNIKQPLIALVNATAITLGVFLIVRGLMKAAKYGTDPRAHSATQILSNLIIGTALCVIGQTADVMMQSVMGSSASGMLQFGDLGWTSINNIGGDVSHFRAAMEAVLTFFQLVGFISFVRGWNIIRNAVEGVGQVTFAQGLTHIIGGVMAMNIYLFLEIFDKTMGTQFAT